MKEQFVTFDIAVRLKGLGFNERCFGTYYDDGEEDTLSDWKLSLEKPKKSFKNNEEFEISAPLWQQCLDWLREKHGLYVYFKPYKPNNIGDIEYVIEEHWSDEVICREIHMWYEFAREEGILKALTLIK